MYCLSSYRDLHVALRSFVTMGSGDHEEAQVPQLWVETDLFSPSNFCARYGDMFHSISVCDPPESKERGPFCGHYGSSDHKVTHCSGNSKFQDNTSSTAIEALVDSDYNDSTNFSRDLKTTVTSDVASVTPPYKIPVPLVVLDSAGTNTPTSTGNSHVFPTWKHRSLGYRPVALQFSSGPYTSTPVPM